MRRHNGALFVVSTIAFLFILGPSLLASPYEGVRTTIPSLVWPENSSQAEVTEVGTVLADSNKDFHDSETTEEEPETLPSSLSSSFSLQASTETCDDMRVLVDKSQPLPPGYTPEDLVSLQSYGVPVLGSSEVRLRHEATIQLKDLVSAAAASGEELVVASAYRSYEDQQAVHGSLSSVYGPNADVAIAFPGHSQHQLGTTVDFTNAKAGYQVWEPFGYTTASQWLESHAHKYGFILSYPNGHESDTGYKWEPWHYRYIGAENAKRLAESGMILQEFLVSEGVLPDC